jgi:hypothetical protein
MPNFSSFLVPDGFRQNFDLFSRKIQDFLKENLEFFKSEIKSKYRFPKSIFYQILSHFWKFSKLISKFFDSWFFKGISKYQNSEYEAHQVGSNGAFSQNFSFLALNTAEQAAFVQKPPATTRDRRKIFFALKSFYRYKKS